MSATPYELRAQLLKQAEGILMNRFFKDHDVIRENIHLSLKKDRSAMLWTILMFQAWNSSIK